MFITCPSCTSRYQVPKAALPAEGRVVRCATCGHVWTELPDSDDNRPMDIAFENANNYGIEEPRRLYDNAPPAKGQDKRRDDKKAKKQPKPAKAKAAHGHKEESLIASLTPAQRISILAGTVTWLALMLGATLTSDSWMRYVIPVTVSDDAMRMMAIENIRTGTTKSGQMSISATLVNITREKLVAPPLLVSVRDKDKNMIRLGRIVLSEAVVDPGNEAAVKGTFDMPDEVKNADSGDVLIQFESDPQPGG